VTAPPTQRAHRPAVAGPVAVAAVFLAIIGGSVGFVLGDRADRAEQVANQSQDTGEQPADQNQDPAADPAPPPPEPQQPDNGTEQPTDGEHCPDHTVRLAHRAGSSGDLDLKLYLHTNRSEVWICVDGSGTLFYQGHRGSPGQRLVEGKNALFLTTVETEGDGYKATNADTTYHVTSEKLVIERHGNREEEPAQ
jgi:hypothetical protein